jgi:hypothetical protein
LSGPSAGSDPLPGRAGAGELARGHGHGMGSRAGGVEMLPTLVFALLVIACFAALIVTQRLKHTPTLVQEFKRASSFSPQSPGPHRLEAISFKLAQADEVTVTIVSSSGQAVALLVRDRPVARYKRLSLRWNGREGPARGYRVLTSPHGYKSLLPLNRGRIAPAGEYGIRIGLRGADRTIPAPRDFTLVGE